jgi:hypothetical protein
VEQQQQQQLHLNPSHTFTTFSKEQIPSCEADSNSPAQEIHNLL